MAKIKKFNKIKDNDLIVAWRNKKLCSIDKKKRGYYSGLLSQIYL